MSDLNKKIEIRRGPQDATDFLSKKISLDDKKSFGKAEEEKEPQRNIFQRLKDNVMGTEKQNKEAAESLKRAGYKAGGKVKSASARADGCAIRGKTRA
jgi:hypothetical protein